MSEEEVQNEMAKPRRLKLPIIAGMVLAVVGGAVGFFIMSQPASESSAKDDKAVEKPIAAAYFVELTPITIPLGDGPTDRRLRVKAHLEVERGESEAIKALTPRVLDVLHTYLRAVELSTLEDRKALVVLRAQMLRRVQVVVGSPAVKDLLITEFIVN